MSHPLTDGVPVVGEAHVLPLDDALAGMVLLHRPVSLCELLTDRLGHWLPPGTRVWDTHIAVRHFYPGKRCVAELELIIGPGTGGAAEGRRVLGKFYSDDHGAAVHETLCQLRDHGFGTGPFLVPRPLGYDAAHRLLLLEWTQGQSLHARLIGSFQTTESVDSAAAWLVRLHRCGVTTGRPYTRSRHVHTLTVWLQELAAVFPEGEQLLAQLATGFLDRSHTLAEWTAGPTHRDFTPEHLVASGAQLVGLDLDEFCQYDPLFDVAHFRAHLRFLGLLHFGALHYFDGLADRFIASYTAAGGDDCAPRRSLYEGMAFVKLSRFVALVRQVPGWKHILPVLLGQARSSIDEYAS